jgi:hypothetical protein
MTGLLTFMDRGDRAQIAAWSRKRAGDLHKTLGLPNKGSSARVARMADALTAAYELGYLRRVREQRRREVPL